MKKFYSLLLSLAAFAIPGQLYAVALVGVYDENVTQSNSVDISAAFVSGTGLATAANVLSVTTFKTNVEAAFPLGFGGVLNFDAVINADDQIPTTGITSPFGGTFSTKSQAISLTLSSGNNVFRQMNLTNRTPISAGNGAAPGGALNTQDETPGSLTIGFGVLTGGAVDERVTQAGFTFLSRASRDFGVVTAIATFGNGDTVTASFTNTIFTAGSQDAFFGFVASPGTYISSINLSTQNEYQFSIDDLGIVTSVIPEPGTFGFLVLGGLMMALRRRK